MLQQLVVSSGKGGASAVQPGVSRGRGLAHLISGIVMRFSGSTSSMRGMRSLAPGLRWLGSV
jgi:hypothetical protein